MNRVSNANVVLEKIKILQRIIPQNDAIWENLLKYINNLLFVEVSESVLQQSPINNTNANPDISPQLTSKSNLTFNCSHHQLTNNLPDVVSQLSQQNIISTPRLLRSLRCRNSRSRNACNASVPERSEETDSRNIVSEFQYRTYYEYYINERLVMQEARNSRTSRQSSRTNNESTEESDSTLRSESSINALEEDVASLARNTHGFNDENGDSDNSVAAFRQKSTLQKPPSVVNTNSSMSSQNIVIDTIEARKPPDARYYFRNAKISSKVNQKRPRSEESANHGTRKRPKKDEIVEESIHRSSFTSLNTKKIVKPTNSSPKKNDLDLIVVNTDPSMSSPNTVIDIEEATKPLNAKRTKKMSSTTQPKENTKPIVKFFAEFDNENEDRDDFLASFFRKQKKLCIEIPRVSFVANTYSSMS